MAAALDPTPSARKRWQRKIVIRDIRGRGRLSKTEKIARTERQHLVKSPFIKTSVKKLYPLARQIAGKPLGEAMVQMRFSRKKAAVDVLKHLQHARDQAVVIRGMGLGKVGQQQQQQQKEEGSVLAETKAIPAPKTKEGEDSLVVVDKKGKRRVVTDPTAMYVDEAWVGRGKYEHGSDHRARGQVHRTSLPYTSEYSSPPLSPLLFFTLSCEVGGTMLIFGAPGISVVIKEEKTRIRQMQDRELKRQNAKAWVPLPDRRVTAQRQYCLW